MCHISPIVDLTPCLASAFAVRPPSAAATWTPHILSMRQRHGHQTLHLCSAPLVPRVPWQNGSSRMALLPSSLPWLECGCGGQRWPAGAAQPLLLRCSDFMLGCPALHNLALNRKELFHIYNTLGRPIGNILSTKTDHIKKGCNTSKNRICRNITVLQLFKATLTRNRFNSRSATSTRFAGTQKSN